MWWSVPLRKKPVPAVSPCWALSEDQSSKLLLCVWDGELERGGRALSMCDSSVPDTLITLHVTCWLTHTHLYIKKTRESQRAWKSQTSTTRKRSGRKELVNIEWHKWEWKVNLSFPCPHPEIILCFFCLFCLPFFTSFTLNPFNLSYLFLLFSVMSLSFPLCVLLVSAVEFWATDLIMSRI